jgi:alanine dehydrogenase
MNIVFLKENKSKKYISILPEDLVKLNNHKIFIQTEIGKELNIGDEEYQKNGATIIKHLKDVNEPNIVVKLSELTNDELKQIKSPEQILIANLYLANNPVYLKELLKYHITSLGIEMYHTEHKYEWLLHNEVLKARFGTNDYLDYLTKTDTKGIFKKFVEKNKKRMHDLKYVIINYSYTTHALVNALPNKHNITILESNHSYKELFKDHGVKVLDASFDILMEEVKHADVLINTTTIPGDLTHLRITKDMIQKMPQDSIYLDLGADQGFGSEITEEYNTPKHPFALAYKKVINIVLQDIGSLYPKESSEFTSKIIVRIINDFENDIVLAIKKQQSISNAILTFSGEITNEVIGKALKLKYKEI